MGSRLLLGWLFVCVTWRCHVARVHRCTHTPHSRSLAYDQAEQTPLDRSYPAPARSVTAGADPTVIDGFGMSLEVCGRVWDMNVCVRGVCSVSALV